MITKGRNPEISITNPAIHPRFLNYALKTITNDKNSEKPSTIILSDRSTDSFRMSYDTVNDRILVADFGQNEIKEINALQNGGNYGWHAKEGSILDSW